MIMTTGITTEIKHAATHAASVFDICARAMLVSLRISSWTARKYDRKITAEVNSSHGAVQDAGRYNKMLLPGNCESYKAIVQLVGNIRTEHYQNTLSWSDEGWRILPTANYLQYSEFTRKRRAEFDKLLNEFIGEYPILRDAAKIRLNGMYKEEDYPPASQIQGKFGFYLDFAPLPAKGDFRLNLPAEEISKIEADTQDRVSRGINEGIVDVWRQLHECVRHIHDRTIQPDTIFRDSLIYNARELCDRLSRLNLTGDKNLEAFRAEIESDLVSSDPDALRENDQVRSDTATLAEDIMQRMSAFFTPSTDEH
jgi:hypothetical protein